MFGMDVSHVLNGTKDPMLTTEIVFGGIIVFTHVHFYGDLYCTWGKEGGFIATSA